MTHQCRGSQNEKVKNDVAENTVENTIRGEGKKKKGKPATGHLESTRTKHGDYLGFGGKKKHSCDKWGGGNDPPSQKEE